MVLFDRKLPGDYFGMKIRKIGPVINAVEGPKLKFPLILAHPVFEPAIKRAEGPKLKKIFS